MQRVGFEPTKALSHWVSSINLFESSTPSPIDQTMGPLHIDNAGKETYKVYIKFNSRKQI